MLILGMGFEPESSLSADLSDYHEKKLMVNSVVIFRKQ